MKQYSLAIIGALGHLHYVLQSPGFSRCQVIGMAPGLRFDEEEQRLIQKRAQLHPDWTVFTDCRQMLETTHPDIVVVNSIFADNCELALLVLKAGAHVLCEKPLTTEPESLPLLRQAMLTAKTGGQHLAGMFGLRYDPAVYTLLQTVSAGKIGQIVMINAQKSYKMGARHPMYRQRQTYGGTIPWVAIHAIDWICRLVGNTLKQVQAIQTCSCNADNGDLESGALCIFTLKNGAIASVNADLLRPESAQTHGDDRIRVVGSAGTVEMQNGKVFLTDATGCSQLSLLTPGDLFSDFLQQIESGCTGSWPDDLYVTHAALCARQAADTGLPVDIPPYQP